MIIKYRNQVGKPDKTPSASKEHRKDLQMYSCQRS